MKKQEDDLLAFLNDERDVRSERSSLIASANDNTYDVTNDDQDTEVNITRNDEAGNDRRRARTRGNGIDRYLRELNDDGDDAVDTYFSDERITIPDVDDTYSFNLRKLWAFVGPGLLISIAFLDPGNVESDLQVGTIASYKLLWVLSCATLLGLLMQRLSARLGVVTGSHLAETCHKQFSTLPRLLLWIMTEIAIIGSDMQEVIGTAIAIYLLSSRAIPLWVGVLVTIFDTFTFLFLDRYGLRKLELLFGFFVTVMAATFGYEYLVSSPPIDQIVDGLVIPWCRNCDNRALLQAVGLVGANVQPHNLYLHSALVKTRDIDRREPRKIREANMYFFTEAAVALLVSFFINLFVVSVFAAGLYEKTNSDVYQMCASSNFSMADGIFPNDNSTINADLYNGGIYLGCRFGFWAMIIWSVGLLASGQSSTMTGTYAGQYVMEGFLNLKWPRWKRVLLTRSIAILPTFVVAFYTSIDSMTRFNDILNVLMSLQLPFAALPTVAFTSNARIMGEFKNGFFNNFAATTLTLVVITINVYLVYLTVLEANPANWVIAGVAVVTVFYVSFCVYLLIYLAIGMGATWLKRSKIIARYVRGPVDRTLGYDVIDQDCVSNAGQ